jgi:hypothetical protein
LTPFHGQENSNSPQPKLDLLDERSERGFVFIPGLLWGQPSIRKSLPAGKYAPPSAASNKSAMLHLVGQKAGRTFDAT